MKKILIILFMFAGASALSACDLNWHPADYIHNRVGEYQPGYSVAPLKLPEGVAAIPDNTFYRIPDVPNPNGPAVTLLSPGSEAMKQAKVKDQKEKQKVY